MTKLRVRQNNPVIVGRSTRFTVIHPHCIRIEFHTEGRFVDSPSLFAIHRDVRCPDFQVTQDGDTIVIDTGAIQLRYRNDGHKLGAQNLSAKIRHGAKWVNWRPGQPNRGNLGGTAETLDGWVGARALEPGLLSRDGRSLRSHVKPVQTWPSGGAVGPNASRWLVICQSMSMTTTSSGNSFAAYSLTICR